MKIALKVMVIHRINLFIVDIFEIVDALINICTLTFYCPYFAIRFLFWSSRIEINMTRDKNNKIK